MEGKKSYWCAYPRKGAEKIEEGKKEQTSTNVEVLRPAKITFFSDSIVDEEETAGDFVEGDDGEFVPEIVSKFKKPTRYYVSRSTKFLLRDHALIFKRVSADKCFTNFFLQDWARMMDVLATHLAATKTAPFYLRRRPNIATKKRIEDLKKELNIKNESQFFDEVDQLISLTKETGTNEIPNTPEYSKLRAWVSQCRTKMRQHTLPQWKYEILCSIGFPWERTKKKEKAKVIKHSYNWRNIHSCVETSGIFDEEVVEQTYFDMEKIKWEISNFSRRGTKQKPPTSARLYKEGSTKDEEQLTEEIIE